ncbi:hypothetical protein [Pacificoceanicola onchidii]|uniref:hypothetical protein n=1 Tax=Pacificoceanicola onchidii TaxID=2562685 RepID=UPI0010A3FCED|nr:hypothetical protein [Pacificoceanicola onchidii]
MTLAPEIIADSFVSLSSLLGLFFFGQVLRAQYPREPVTRRFLFAIRVVALMLAARLVQWLTGWEGIGRLTFLAAGLIPLAALLVSEALMRRHAPAPLKLWTAGGAGLLALAALFTPGQHAGTALVIMAAYQALTFAALVALVLTRDRSALSPSENRTLDRLLLALALILPLALTDFRIGALDMPVRLSGLAILALCWLALSLRSGADQSRLSFSVLAVTTGIVLAAAFAISALATLDARATVQVVAITLAAAMLALVFVAAKRARRQARGALLAKLSQAQTLGDLVKTFEAAGMTRLEGASLTDFDARFRAYLNETGLLRAQDVPTIADASLKEQANWLFTKFGATHAFLLSESPFQIMALTVPGLAQSERQEQEFRLARRMAVLLKDNEARP